MEQYHTRSVQCFAAAALVSCSLAHPACFRKAFRTLFVHTERAVMFPFRTSNVIRSVLSPTFCHHRKFPVARVSARSLIGSPRCEFTFIRKVALPARTHCVSRQTISRKISASGAVASVAFPPCPTHFLMAHHQCVDRSVGPKVSPFSNFWAVKQRERVLFIGTQFSILYT